MTVPIYEATSPLPIASMHELMLTLSTRRAAPGMVLALPVFHPEKLGHELLKPGFCLDQTAIESLREIGVHDIAVHYPPTAFLLRYSSPTIFAEQSKLAQRVAIEVDKMTSGLCATLDFAGFSDAVRDLIQRFVDDPMAAVFLREVISTRQPMAAHAFNVGLLSLLMGLKLDGYLVLTRARISPRRAQNIEHLGLGALLHDIGMTRLAPEDLERFYATHDESDAQWQRHTILGFNLVKGRIPATASAAVLHHHQRMDGSGFPKRVRGYGPPTPLSGSEIHVFARIVALADAFDRARNPSGSSHHLGHMHDGPIPTVRALRAVLDQVRTGKLDGMVFKSMLNVVPAFAPGSIVTLSNGQRCVVTAWDPMNPCVPTVCPLDARVLASFSAPSDSLIDEHPLGEAIDLAEHPDLHITHVDGVDVRADLFWPVTPGEFDLRRQYAFSMEPPEPMLETDAA